MLYGTVPLSREFVWVDLLMSILKAERIIFLTDEKGDISEVEKVSGI